MTHALLTIGYFAACALGVAAVMLYRFDDWKGTRQ